MTTYYVGSGGNDGNAGTSWATRKLTLNGVEDIPVAAGDTVYVGPGTYRELLTVDVSGSSGNPIAYIGDYDGSHTDGVGGVVRITGSDNDQTATRSYAIHDNNVQRNYRTFRGFQIDTTSSYCIYGQAAGTNWIIEDCVVFLGGAGGGAQLYVNGANQSAWTIRRCYFDYPASQGKSIYFNHSSTVDNTEHVVQNCIIRGHGHNNAVSIRVDRVGGVTVRNCNIANVRIAIGLSVALSAGQTLTVNNCILAACDLALYAVAADGTFVENYNCFYVNSTDRTNVGTGANSVGYVPLFDTRWFFEAVNDGNMVTPFDLASVSPLVELNSGASAPTADMRGTTVQGTYREWGPLEYLSTLDIEAGSGSSGGGGPVIGSRIIRGLGAV